MRRRAPRSSVAGSTPRTTPVGVEPATLRLRAAAPDHSATTPFKKKKRAKEGEKFAKKAIIDVFLTHILAITLCLREGRTEQMPGKQKAASEHQRRRRRRASCGSHSTYNTFVHFSFKSKQIHLIHCGAPILLSRITRSLRPLLAQ